MWVTRMVVPFSRFPPLCLAPHFSSFSWPWRLSGLLFLSLHRCERLLLSWPRLDARARPRRRPSSFFSLLQVLLLPSLLFCVFLSPATARGREERRQRRGCCCCCCSTPLRGRAAKAGGPGEGAKTTRGPLTNDQARKIGSELLSSNPDGEPFPS